MNSQTLTPPAALPARPRPRLARLPLVGGGLACAALVLAMLLGPGGRALPVVVLGGAAVGVLTAELARRSNLALRQGGGARILLAVLGSAVVAMAWLASVTVGGGQLAAAVWCLALGAGLGLSGLSRTRTRRAAGATPWQALTGGPTRAAEARTALLETGALLLGAAFLLLGFTIGWGWVTDRFYAFVGVFGRSGLLVIGAALVAGVTLVGSLLIAWFVFGRAVRAVGGGAAGRPAGSVPGTPAAAPAVARDEQVVAAHLHDSVLQTLTLIQRNADDPARVGQLARQQERSLRSWLAGRDETTATTLAGALRLAAQEVEDEEPGAVIEVVAVGDAPLDRGADAMVRAAREAMRNAVRHAGSPVRVFVEVEGEAREVYVRDTGAGFALGDVAEERRGVRDAIIGRMEHVGGEAVIDSGPGGTEVALRLAAPGGASA